MLYLDIFSHISKSFKFSHKSHALGDFHRWNKPLGVKFIILLRSKNNFEKASRCVIILNLKVKVHLFL